jgi:hypothetical protein
MSDEIYVKRNGVTNHWGAVIVRRMRIHEKI